MNETLTALLRFLFNIFFQFKLGEELDFRYSLLNIGQIFIYLFFLVILLHYICTLPG